MLGTSVRLHDIDDVEGFVCATIERSSIQAPAHEKEELVADGISILYGLAAKFEPHREGYEQAGRFSGYAAQFLPRRLGDAWHSRHPEHVRVVNSETGKREWKYRDTPISLDAFLVESTGPHRRADQHTQIRPATQQAPVPLPA